MNDSIYLERCKVLVQEKVKLGDIKSWKNKDFQYISHEISTVSKISISTDTLKRVFGKLKTYKTYYNPQDETKNAIAIYLGYENWENFKIHNRDVKHHEPILFSRLKYVTSKKIIFLGLAGIFAVSVVILLLSFYKRDYTERFTFTGKNLTGYAPHTSIFNYDITGIKSDSVAIDYDWTITMIERLKKNDHTITTIHGEPGYYHIKLLVDNKPISTLGVHVLTRGWEANVSTPTGIKHELDSNYIVDGLFYLSDKEFQKTGVDPEVGHNLKFFNYKDFGVNGDNFEFELKAKNTKEIGGLDCYDVQFEIICEYGKVLVLFVKKGCHKYARFQLSEVNMEGHNNDLSAFGQDLLDWRLFKIKINDKKGFIYFDNNIVYERAYTKSLGEVKGIVLSFRGRGMADFVKLHNGSEKLIYADDFND